MSISRRDALGLLGGVTLGGLLAGMGAVTMSAQDGLAAKVDEKAASLWTPHKLDAAECAPRAYAGYYHQGFGCCYGVFESIVGGMGRMHGAPYNQFPFAMMEVGKSGISDWGTICGALLGGASAMALFWGRKDRDPMVTELFRWYEKTAFPVYTPPVGGPGLPGALPTHVPESVLCHVSVSTWCYATGISAHDKRRNERCARITADVATKTIEIMNAKIDGGFAAKFNSSAEATCLDCHGKDKVSPVLKGRMDCTPCHSGSVHVQNKFKNHP